MDTHQGRLTVSGGVNENANVRWKKYKPESILYAERLCSSFSFGAQDG